MSEQKQCCAPLSNGKRCPKDIIDDSSIHCEDHYPRGIRLYKTYKILSKFTKTINLTKVDTFSETLNKIKYLNECYLAYFKAYEGRMEHRLYGLVPECYDYGHNKQFKIIMDNINYCESELENLYEQYFKEKQPLEVLKDKDAAAGKIDIEEEVRSSDEYLKIQEIIEKVNNFKKKRANDKREENIAIEHYIKENKKIINQKLVLVDEIITLLKSYMKINPEYEYYQIISIYAMITVINTIVTSFNKDKRNTNILKNLYLGDSSLKKYNNSRDYLLNEPEERLIIVLNHLKKHFSLIKNFFSEAERFWNSEGIDPFRVSVFVAWNPYEKKFLMGYGPQIIVDILASMKKFSQIEKMIDVKGTIFNKAPPVPISMDKEF